MTAPTHTVRAYTHELDQLRGLVAEMGGRTEVMAADAIRALRRRDPDLARRVVDSDAKVDKLEDDVEDLVVRMLALRQPVAGDLRTIVTALKSASNLERIGDYAKNIARRTQILIEAPVIANASGVLHLSNMVESMLHDVLDAYVNTDAEKAMLVRDRDSDVDTLHTGLFRELLTYMMEDPRTITGCTHMAFIAKNLERIGDHVTNVAEGVLYEVRGVRPAERHTGADVAALVDDAQSRP